MQTTKYYKLRIGSEIGILLEFFLNAFKCLTVSISTEIVILAKRHFYLFQLASSVQLATCYTARCVRFSIPSGKMGTDLHIWKHIHQKH